MAPVADSLQLDVRVVTAGGDRARQAAQVDSFAMQGVAAILIDPIDPAALGDAISRAARARIPVFTMVTATVDGDTNDIVAHVGSDDRMGGELAGWYVGQRLNGGGSIAILDQPSLPAVRDRVRASAWPSLACPTSALWRAPPWSRPRARRRGAAPRHC